MLKRGKDTRIIHSLDKGLLLLEIIEQETYPVTLNTLWQKLKWDKATILRMCNTLERRGYIRRDPSTKRYSLGLKIFGLYESIKKNIDVQRMARPYLERIEKKTGESAHMAFVFEKSVVFIDKVVGRTTPPVNVQVGGREPLHCTALGQAYLAFTNETELENLLENPLKKYTRNTIETTEELYRRLQKVREQGYAVDDEEYIEGVRCVAAPILNQSGYSIAAIGISAPKRRLSFRLIREYGEYIVEAALEISKWLGYTRSGRLPVEVP
ncbi:MAG: IclR family transcriptional regulator [Spirochaetota bacterium]